jgi:1-hydroxycarotenoid 3,4-desaturase
MRNAVVIGAGVGGLAAALQLRRAGMAVTLLERGERVGGKLREIEVAGRRLPGGPSVLTMRHVFEELFEGRLHEYVELVPVEPLCRHFWPDGAQLDLFIDAERTAREIERLSGAADSRGYLALRRRAARVYEAVRGPFMERPLSWTELASPRGILAMTRIDGMRSLWKALEEHFRDPRLRQLFGRYATYNGSSPLHAPATLQVILHVENAFGIFAARGGIYRLAEALLQRARDAGVEVRTGAEVEEVLVERERARGVRLRGETLRADVVVANCDVAQLYEQLLPAVKAAPKLAAKYRQSQLSSSAYVLLGACKRAPLDLLHHDVFFSRDYPREFGDLIDRRAPPDEPTVYLCADDRPPLGAPPDDGTERFFLLTNAPPLDERGGRVDWEAEAARCRARIVAALARFGWPLETVAEQALTPPAFAARFPASRGALYGLSSNSAMAAFKRPPNKVAGVAGLYCVGGTVHPGAGLPMVALSAKMAAELAVKESA